MHDTARMRQAQPDGTGFGLVRQAIGDDFPEPHMGDGLIGYIPAGRPLVPGQDATPHAGKDLRFLAMFAIGFTVGIVVGAVGVVL